MSYGVEGYKKQTITREALNGKMDEIFEIYPNVKTFKEKHNIKWAIKDEKEKGGNPVDIITNTVLISVKSSSSCWFNPTPKMFYKNKKIYKNLLEYKDKAILIIFEERKVATKYKEPTYLILKKRLKKEIIDEWDKFSKIEKQDILSKLFCYKKMPDYEFYFEAENLRIYKFGNYYIDVICGMLSDVEKISFLNDEKTDYVYIMYDNKKCGKIQVKFSNGIENKTLRYNFWIDKNFKDSILDVEK